MSANVLSDDDISEDEPGHMPDFEALARDIQNRASRHVGTATTEARHFNEFFGTSVLVVEKTWELLKRDSLLPEGGRPKHLLWALHFMKVYPKQSPGCSAVGALAGAVDPKTHRKWVWAFIDAVTNLVNTVVSFRRSEHPQSHCERARAIVRVHDRAGARSTDYRSLNAAA
jgi:hypothetical protein